jgi:hypothetical protein
LVLAPWLALFAAVLTLLAMRQYTGGTALDARTIGYAPDQNFLSDLGMTVAYDGRANTLGAALFLASICAMVVAFGTALWHFVKRYLAIPASRRAAQAAGVTATIVSVLSVGGRHARESHDGVARDFFGSRHCVPANCCRVSRSSIIAPRGHGWSALTIIIAGISADVRSRDDHRRRAAYDGAGPKGDHGPAPLLFQCSRATNTATHAT